ncbi:MAG TPA: hypothetical protein VM120_20355, partial [Bryobacteraceae bacterium]|nr:hypothetical protein [Bryobacteraceae bacterium]
LGGGGGVIHFLQGGPGSGEKATAKEKLLSPGELKGSAHPLGKHLEISGLRVTESANRKLEVRMIIVNHSAADLPEMKLSVHLKPSNAGAGSPPISTFNVKLPALGGFESREIKTTAITKLRAYEFPDWQFLRTDFEVLSP